MSRKEPQALTVAEAAEQMHCHPATVRHLIHEGRLPAARVGRLWRVAPADLADLFTTKREPSR